jgi:hypothetical protein
LMFEPVNATSINGPTDINDRFNQFVNEEGYLLICSVKAVSIYLDVSK